MDEQQKAKLRSLARQALALCGEDADYIRIVADTLNGTPYASVYADMEDVTVYNWHEFPKEGRA